MGTGRVKGRDKEKRQEEETGEGRDSGMRDGWRRRTENPRKGGEEKGKGRGENIAPLSFLKVGAHGLESDASLIIRLHSVLCRAE